MCSLENIRLPPPDALIFVEMLRKRAHDMYEVLHTSTKERLLMIVPAMFRQVSLQEGNLAIAKFINNNTVVEMVRPLSHDHVLRYREDYLRFCILNVGTPWPNENILHGEQYESSSESEEESDFDWSSESEEESDFEWSSEHEAERHNLEIVISDGTPESYKGTHESDSGSNSKSEKRCNSEKIGVSRPWCNQWIPDSDSEYGSESEDEGENDGIEICVDTPWYNRGLPYWEYIRESKVERENTEVGISVGNPWRYHWILNSYTESCNGFEEESDLDWSSESEEESDFECNSEYEAERQNLEIVISDGTPEFYKGMHDLDFGSNSKSEMKINVGPPRRPNQWIPDSDSEESEAESCDFDYVSDIERDSS